VARRVNLPSADDLFRPTDTQSRTEPAPRERRVRAVPAAQLSVQPADDDRRRPSGRVRHDEKITIYVTADELVDVEHARLELRRHHGLAVDRGRLVREALALILADLGERGHDSMLVQRLIED
jgi:hypothetical protein